MSAVAALPDQDVRPAHEWPYKFESIPLDDLAIDESYQRPATTFVNEVARDWNPMLVGAIFVSEREDGARVIVDGQTRWRAALQRREAGEPVPPDLPSLTYYGLTPSEEAQLMSQLAKKRRQIRTIEAFKAAYIGNDPDAKGIVKIAKKYRIELLGQFGQHDAPPITAFEAAYRARPFADLDGKKRNMLDAVLWVMDAAWHRDGEAQHPAVARGTGNQILRGLRRFLETNERVDLLRLADRLAEVEPKIVRARAQQLAQAKGAGAASAPYVAEVVLTIYGKRRSSK